MFRLSLLNTLQESAEPKADAPKEANDANSSSSNSTGGSPSSNSAINDAVAPTARETPNSQAMYEQSVLDKENSLINSFSNLIIDENAKNNLQQYEVSNGKMHVETTAAATIPAAVANGNGHIENVNNKK